MKKTLLASAALLISGAAMAQSSVTMYGVVDFGIGKSSVNGLGLDNGKPGSLTASQSFHTPTRIGVRGTEDLGNGLSAVFVLETGFNVDDGALGQGGLLFGRQSFVGLRNSWGTFSFGRQYDLLYAGSPLPLDIGALLLGGLAGATGGAGTAVDNH